jgi:lipopolysaccharide transport system permease protein
MLGLLHGAWRFRDFVFASVRREFASRYLGTQLGVVWPIVQPLALIVIYTLVFAGVMRPRLPGHDSVFAYSIYLTAGFITWALFSDLLGRSVGVFVQNAHLLKKVNIHKLAFPAIAALSALLQFAILLGGFMAFLLATGHSPGWPLLAALPVIAVTTLLAMGLGLFLATINVFYRDVEQTMNLVLQFWFWLTPIVYPVGALPPALQQVLSWNPMWPIVRAMQAIFLENRFPEWLPLAYPLALAVAFIFLARTAYERLANELVDEL